MKITVAFLFVLIACLTVSESEAYETIADACAWLNRTVGYGCDGKSERWIWQQYNRFRYGVTDCRSYCVKKLNKKDGRCVSGAIDNSSWCPAGQSCRCS